MPLITYKFADGHSEEIEVSCEVAETYAQILKYEKKIKRQNREKLKSLEKLAEKGFDKPAPNTDVFEIWEKREQEEFERRQEQRRKEKLSKWKKQLEDTLTPRQAQAYFLFHVPKYCHSSLHRQNGNIIVYTGSRKWQSHKSNGG